jgi:hypothetical protein
MSEQEDAMEDLRANGVADGLDWAWLSARRQTLQSLDPDTGHDQGWVGYNAFKVLTDRLDRVFSLGRFAIELGADPALGADLVAQGLLSGEFDRMPHLRPGLVIRDDLNRSPGWRCGGWRILLQSFGGQDIDRIPWPQKSWTKKKVAKQPAPDQPMLEFPEIPMALDVLADLSNLPASDISTVTLVGAYSIDAVTGDSEFYIGHPRFNDGGGEAWHWKVLFGGGGFDGGLAGRPLRTPDGTPMPPVADAPVRLRRKSKERFKSKGED